MVAPGTADGTQIDPLTKSLASSERSTSYVTDTPLAIDRKKLDNIVAFLDLRLAGGVVPEAVRAEMRAARLATRRNQGSGSVAVVPIIGSISYRMSVLHEASDGTSVQEIQRNFRDAMAESSVSTILLDIDSPGGVVPGIPELADEIFAARSKKRIVAVANTMSASAAYWLMSAATEAVVTPSGEVGSIGVYAMHLDESAALEMKGLKPTFISAGKLRSRAIRRSRWQRGHAPTSKRTWTPFTLCSSDRSRVDGACPSITC